MAVLLDSGGVLTCTPSKEAPSLPLPAQEAADEPAAEQTQEPVRVFAAADLSNLASDAPDIPIYDKHTLAERRAAGLPTALPDIAP